MDKKIQKISAIILASFLITIVITLVLWTDRTLDFWCSYFKGDTINIPIWLSTIVTFLSDGAILSFNIVSEILRLFII